MTPRVGMALVALLVSLAMTLMGCGGSSSQTTTITSTSVQKKEKSPSGTTSTTTTNSDTPSDIVYKLGVEWADAYNAGKFTEMVALYKPWGTANPADRRPIPEPFAA